MKYLSIFLFASLLASCGGDDKSSASKISGSKGSDGDVSTYDTCQITQSNALFASDRSADLSQCWSIKPTRDQTNALSQCRALVSNYIGNRYVVGHSVEYSVASTSCPLK